MSRTSCSLALLFLLSSTAFAAADVALATVHVTIRPALAARVSGPELTVKIRLAQGTEALVWKGQTCNVPAVDAKAIDASGSYSMPLNEVPGEGATICVRSSDGLLAAQIVL